jgi:hypothetical protein
LRLAGLALLVGVSIKTKEKSPIALRLLVDSLNNRDSREAVGVAVEARQEPLVALQVPENRKSSGQGRAIQASE